MTFRHKQAGYYIIPSLAWLYLNFLPSSTILRTIVI